MTDNRTKVLFVCTTNTTRSVLAQFVLDRFGYSRFKSSSAGIIASGIPMCNELAEVLAHLGYSQALIDGFKSTQIDEKQIKDILAHINDYQPFVDKNREIALAMAPWSIRIKKIMNWLTELGYKI